MGVVLMSKQKLNIWGRNFELDIVLQRDKNGNNTEEQGEALDILVSSINEIEESKSVVEKYILNNGLNEKSVDNIFKYVIPKDIYIPKKSKGLAVIICNYKFDVEHGLAIVFDKGKCIDVCEPEKYL